MNKMITRLISVALILLVSMIMVVMSTYAWLTMSGSPEVGGVKITIGGLDTILVAPDISFETADGVVHYPGKFEDKINFSRESGYDYLKNIVALSPYSTSDGIHWFGAGYNSSASATDSSLGQLLPLGELPLDETLARANLESLPDDGSVSGCYAYLDFWIVSPIENCKLRVSSGDAKSSSFAIDLKDVIYTDTDDDGVDDSYVLKENDTSVSSSVRIGFLVNNDRIEDASMQQYVYSPHYFEKYHSLCGEYQNPGDPYFRTTRFTIFEPNADKHTSSKSYVYTNKGIISKEYSDGSYVVTNPIGFVNGSVQTVDISDILTVQKTSKWITAENSEDVIDQVFKGYVHAKNGNIESAEKLFTDFYTDHLQYQYSLYINGGSFVKSTSDLYRAAVNGVVDKEGFDQLRTEGATEEVYITELEKDVPQKIRMFIWIEGQDVDCVNASSGKKFSVSLELAGGNN